MSNRQKIALSALVSVLAWLVLIAWDLIPLWFAVLIAVLVVAATVVAWWYWGTASTTPPATVWTTAPPLPPPPARSIEVVGLVTALPTDIDGVNLGLTATVSYEVVSRVPHADPAAAARVAIQERAEAVSRVVLPVEIERLRDRLADVLGRREADGTRGIIVWADDVRLDPPDDSDRVITQVALLRQHRERERGRVEERAVRRYFGEDVLSDTGSVLVWWLARRDIRQGDLRVAEITEAVGLVENFDVLTAVSQNRPRPTSVTDLPTATATAPDDVRTALDLLDRLFPSAEERDERLLFIDALLQRAEDFDRLDFAQRLRFACGLAPTPNAATDDREEYPVDEGGPDGEADPDEPEDPFPSPVPV